MLETFNEKHRLVIELHVFGGLTAGEVCDRIEGMSEDNVAQIASRFRAKLRARLDPGGGPMTDVDRLLADYIAEHRAGGEADPREYLSRASPAQRTELAALIDAYLARAPRQPFDQAAFRGSSAERTVDELERAIAGQAGLWPAAASAAARPRRAQAQRRSSSGSRPRSASSDRQDKVAGYYHEMEQGLLPAEGVSDRVLDALGQIVGETAQALRDAGRALTPPGEGPPAAPAAAFARRAYAEPAGAPSPGAQPPPEGEWDEVDELFRGG